MVIKGPVPAVSGTTPSLQPPTRVPGLATSSPPQRLAAPEGFLTRSSTGTSTAPRGASLPAPAHSTPPQVHQQLAFDLGTGLSTPHASDMQAKTERPRLDTAQAQRVVDDLLTMMPSRHAQSTTVALTELADGRLLLTASGKTRGLTTAERRNAVFLLARAGIHPQDVLFVDGGQHPWSGEPNPHAVPSKRSHYDMGYDEPSYDPWHAETKGLQAARQIEEEALKQWGSNGPDPTKPGTSGHGGAACHQCDTLMREHGVAAETGVQPLPHEAQQHGAGDRVWRGRHDRSQAALPGLDSQLTRPSREELGQRLKQAAAEWWALQPAPTP